jgi:hypothetical protein
MAAQYWASHSAHGLQCSRVGGPPSLLGQNGTAALQPTTTMAQRQCDGAVTVPRDNATAQPVAAHWWPRWEEVAGTSKRGPRSMR